MKNKLKSFFTEHWKYMAVCTACKLHLFDNLQEFKTVQELASQLLLNQKKLSVLLNALHTIGFLEKQSDRYKINETSILLTENHPESLKYACLNWFDEHLTTWQQLDFSIQTGNSAFENIYGMPFFDYLCQNPEKLHAYHKAMYEYARDDYKNLPEHVDFSKYKSVMDIGGGYGAIIQNIKAKNPQLECVLFDLPEVIQNVNIQGITVIGGSFFEKIPVQADAVILSRVIHDWNDHKANIILQNCYQALYKNGTLYIIENCSDNISIDLSLLSLNMTVICESYERTSAQYIQLAQNAGFEYKNQIKLNELQTILIFEK